MNQILTFSVYHVEWDTLQIVDYIGDFPSRIHAEHWIKTEGLSNVYYKIEELYRKQ